MIREDLYLQVNYLKQASGNLEYFKDKGAYLFNMRCPYCGDSQKSKTKARGYCFRSPVDGLMCFKCHNCNKGASFRAFLKHVNPGLYSRYWFDVFKGSRDGDSTDLADIMKLDTATALEKKLEGLDCTNVTELSRLHVVNTYLKGREIPKERMKDFFYTDNFEKFCNSMQNYSDVPNDPRVMLFETDKFGNVKLIIARSLAERSQQRYVTLRIDEEYPKCFGLSTIDNEKRTFVVEGAIDSLFLDNAVATLDSNLDGNIKNAGIKKPVFVFDNEPRSSIIVAKMRKVIKAGNEVVIFDKKNTCKDIALMVAAGYDMNNYLDGRTFKGIKATAEFNKWEKI